MIYSITYTGSTTRQAFNQVRIRCQAENVKDVKIRRGKQEDMGQIFRMVLRERMNPLSLKPDRFVVAERDGSNELAGCVQLADLKNNFKELRTLIVQPEYRGEGIGQILVSEILKDVGESEVYLVTLESTFQFYEKFGFVTIDPSQVPEQLWVLRIEVVLGKIVAKLLVNKPLIVMKKDIQ
eukprot:TRINITY_DN26009_c0_g1_i6.p1 TRINITY_DN26009_c0_g1~~TRINITY_DN26009_c0_g1_i6.p1  ORF type:complete len:181 (-),score=15.41 TRINITY_DN26009_c0_g1_i6:758-1300(-)